MLLAMGTQLANVHDIEKVSGQKLIISMQRSSYLFTVWPIRFKRFPHIDSFISDWQGFPNRVLPNHQTFAVVERRLCKIDRFAPATADYRREQMIRIPDFEGKKHQTLIGYQVLGISKEFNVSSIQTVHDFLRLVPDQLVSFG